MSYKNLSILLLGLALAYSQWALWHQRPQTGDDTAPTRPGEGMYTQGDEAQPIAPGTVHLRAEARAQAAIRTAPIEAATLHDQLEATATVVDPQPFLDWQRRRQAARSALHGAKLELATARQTRDRQAALNRAGTAAQRVLQQAEAELGAAEIRRRAAADALNSLTLEARRRWGDVLGGMLVDEASLARQLLDGRSTLLLLGLPAGHSLPEPAEGVHVIPPQGGKGVPVRWVSLAPFAEYAIQGETHYFVADLAGWPVGLRLSARIPLPESGKTAAVIPDAAVIWHQGRPWAWLERADGGFRRWPLDDAVHQDGRWLARSGFELSAPLVIEGAQTLLSEESRALIPEEDDD